MQQVDNRDEEKLETAGDNVECDSKKGVVDIDKTKPRGAEVSWRKQQHWTISPGIQVEPQSQQQGLQEVLTSVLDLSDGAAMAGCLRVKLRNGLWWLNSQFEFGGGPQKDRLGCRVC